jgi:hypothetical protein
MGRLIFLKKGWGGSRIKPAMMPTVSFWSVKRKHIGIRWGVRNASNHAGLRKGVAENICKHSSQYCKSDSSRTIIGMMARIKKYRLPEIQANGM